MTKKLITVIGAGALAWTVRADVTPNDPGVVGADDSISIQNAVDLAVKRGEKVVIPAFNKRTGTNLWVFTKCVKLPGHTTLVIDNAHLRMGDGMMDNLFRSANAFTPEGRTKAGRLTDIRILGVGNAVLDGGNHNGLTEYSERKNGLPSVILNTHVLLVNVRNFEMSGLTIKDHRFWGTCFNYCSYGRIAHIRFLAHGTVNNQDGINLRNGCHNILVEDITGQTNDDMIALSGIDGRDADRKKPDPWSRDVADDSPDLYSITIRNVVGCAANHPFISLRNHNGVKIHDILIERVSESDYQEPMANGTNPGRYAMIRLGQALYWHTRPSTIGETRNIVLKDIDARVAEQAIIANATIKNLRISGVNCTGNCRCAFTTFGAVWSAPGVKLENAVLENLSVTSDHPKACVAEFPLFAPDQYVRDCRLVDCSLEKDGKRTVVARETVDRVFDRAEVAKYVTFSEGKTLALHHFRELPPEEVKDVYGNYRVAIEPEIPTDRTPVDGVIMTKWGPMTTHITYNLVFVATPCPVRVTAFGRTEDFGSGCYYFCKNPPEYFW